MDSNQTLKLPEKARLRLVELFRAKQQAERDFLGPLALALEWLGLDPMLAHGVNFDTGVVTPAETPAEPPAETPPAALPEPTPIREEAV